MARITDDLKRKAVYVCEGLVDIDQKITPAMGTAIRRAAEQDGEIEAAELAPSTLRALEARKLVNVGYGPGPHNRKSDVRVATLSIKGLAVGVRHLGL